MDIECSPHTDQDRSVEKRTVSGHPELLLGGAQSYPHDIGARTVDRSHRVDVFLERTREGRGARTHDLEARKPGTESFGEPLSHALGTAVEVMTPSVQDR